jgi:hypothetical protein
MSTPRLSLSDQLRLHEQQKKRMSAREAALQDRARKDRTKSLIRAGTLIEETGLLRLSPEALYGAVLSLAAGAANTDAVAEWTRAGMAKLAQEASDKERVREPIIITFPEPITRPTAGALLKAGFRQNKIRSAPGHIVFEGMSSVVEAEALSVIHHGVVQRVSADEPDLALAAE